MYVIPNSVRTLDFNVWNQCHDMLNDLLSNPEEGNEDLQNAKNSVNGFGRIRNFKP